MSGRPAQSGLVDDRDLAGLLGLMSAEEHARLSALPAAVLTKTRQICPYDGRAFVLDDFTGVLAGLRLAEVEVADLAAPVALPPWAGREVTHDDRFSGGRLAVAGAAEVAELLRHS